MTNQEAIRLIRILPTMCVFTDAYGEPIDSDAYYEAVDMAISALQTQDVPDTNDGDMVSRQRVIDELKRYFHDEYYQRTSIQDCIDCFIEDIIIKLPSAQPEWNNHTVACLLAELFDDTCACNYNGIDEWLPEKCEVIDACPNPVGVACWEQYLKHRAERRADGQTNRR